jgi:hypothetical protein
MSWWNWGHLNPEGWVAHTQRSGKLAGLMLLSGIAMIIHMLIPFWQQPDFLKATNVACVLCSDMKKHQSLKEVPKL